MFRPQPRLIFTATSPMQCRNRQQCVLTAKSPAQMTTIDPTRRNNTTPIEFKPYTPKTHKMRDNDKHDCLYEGRYTPTGSYGKCECHNIYAKVKMCRKACSDDCTHKSSNQSRKRKNGMMSKTVTLLKLFFYAASLSSSSN